MASDTAVKSRLMDGVKSRLTPSRRFQGQDNSRAIPPILGLWPLLLLIVLWQLLGSSSSSYFPRPSTWWTSIDSLWVNGTLVPSLLATLETFILGLIITTILGTLIGTLIGRSSFADRMLGPLLEYCRVLPAPATVPLAVLFGGYSQTMAVGVVVFTSIWPILLQVRASARAVPGELLDVARTMHIGPRRTITKVIWPLLLPGVLLGLRVATPIALISSLLVELITNIGGLGAVLAQAQDNYRAAEVYSLIVVLTVVSVIVTVIVSMAESRLRRRAGR